MTFVQERRLGKHVYIYLEKSIRVGKRVIKTSRYLGKKNDFNKESLKREVKRFALEADKKVIEALMKDASRRYVFTHPLTKDEFRKLEEMNLKYRTIRRALSKRDWADVKKRFVANIVFESNALEGNSLTLKNFTDIIFENRTSGAADMRDVYDAKNSYDVFSRLLTARKDITEQSMIDMHKRIVEDIDDRIGYKRLPNVILGRDIDLAMPEDVPKEVKNLLRWYKTYKDKLCPLELAFKFHHKFERIHPFADGNGRVGRMLLNYILIRKGCYPVIIRKTNRARYIKALAAADNGSYIPLMRFAIDKAKETYRKFFEMYYRYL